MYYNILIDYTTGNSFGHERITNESLGIVTSNLELAKENLLRIKEHYAAYKDSGDDQEYQLKLATDEGYRTIVPFWIGYFETLHGAKIQLIDNSDNNNNNDNNNELSFSL